MSGATMVGIAIETARKGRPVFPCHPETKRPLTSNGFKDATTDEEQIKKWWSQHPKATIGKPTGNGILVVDVDPPAGIASLKKLEAEHGTLPPTMTVKTPRGGLHKVYSTPEAVKCSANGIGADLDIRGEGGYVIAAGSVNAEGKVYELTDHRPPAPAPDWLIHLANTCKNGQAKRQEKEAPPQPTSKATISPYAQKALDEDSRAVETAPEGIRNATLNERVFRSAQLVAGGELPEDLVVETYLRVAMAAGLPQAEAMRTVNSAMAQGKLFPRQAPAKDKEGLPKPSPEPDPTLSPEKLMEVFEVNEDYIKKLGKEEFLYPNLIIKGHVLTIIAMPGGGKTTFLYYHVCPKLAGMGYLVWYVDADSPASDHKRMKETADRYRFKFLNPDVNAGTCMQGILDTLHKIADSHSDLSGRVIFIDTLKKAADLMSKGNTKVFFQLTRKLANLGATVVLLGHANKHRDKDGNLVFEGVGDVRSDSDEMIFFERKTNINGGLDVTTVIDPDRGAKVRGVFKPFSFHISERREITFYDEPHNLVDYTMTTVHKATDEEIISAALEYLFERGESVIQNQLVQHVADLTGAGQNRTRKLIVQHAEPRDTLTRKGLPIVYSIGKRNAHCFELPTV